MYFVNHLRWKWLLGNSLAISTIALLFALAGCVFVAAGVWQIATPVDTTTLGNSAAMESLDDIGRSLLADVSRVVAPAIERTQNIAGDPRVIAAILKGNQRQQAEVCNEEITDSTAVSQFKENSEIISLALLDAVMPKLGGRQVDQIKLSDPNVLAVFCSGYDPETGPVQSQLDNRCRMVHKPYDPNALLRIVREALDERIHVIRVGRDSAAHSCKECVS